MRELPAGDVTALVSQLYQNANFDLPADVVGALERALSRERSSHGRDVLEALLANAEIAGRERVPLCQDTGAAVVFVELGKQVLITGASLQQAVNNGIADACSEGRLRASMVADPCFERRNTGDNTPAVLHIELVEGDGVAVTVLPKGAGSENMSRMAMLKPHDGPQGLVDLALETVELGGANACPPIFLGIGVGGTMDRAAYLGKKALLRNAGEANVDPRLAELEQRVMEAVNSLGIGPAGLGGSETCLGVAIEDYPCHIASLPVAITLQCNAARRARGMV